MNTRKRSPNAPAFSLKEAISKALIAYDKEQLHPVSADVLAGDLGYSNAKTGSSARALSTLKSYGLIYSPNSGMLAVTKDVQDYKFSPDENHKAALLQKWAKGPKQFAKLIAKYPLGTPSEAALQYDLIQDGFSESSAKQVVRDFNESVEFAQLYQYPANAEEPIENATGEDFTPATPPPASIHLAGASGGNRAQHQSSSSNQVPPTIAPTNIDRIPIRLPGGRRAWLEIPEPFYESDKLIIQNQVDLIVADEEA